MASFSSKIGGSRVMSFLYLTILRWVVPIVIIITLLESMNVF
jgi:hypothetical protein